MIFSILAVGLLLVPSAVAFWRLPCARPVMEARVDPIVTRDKASSHAHTIMGSSAIGYSTTFADLRKSRCSTCKVKDDQSAYWIPGMYYEYENKSLQAVHHEGMLVYYLQRIDPNTNKAVQAFPDDLRIFTGNPYARSDAGTPESKAISWKCLNFNGPQVAETPGFANTNCPDGLRAQVFFPSCWDGVNTDSSDHKSHMAYPDRIDSGVCPSTHPVRLISLFFEVYFDVAPYNALNGRGRFVLSNGDPTGYGLHGDFFNGWDRSVLQRAADTCTADSGVIEDCPVFQNEGRFYSDDEMNACQCDDPIPGDVNVVDPVPYLPGCVAVTEGPASATPADLASGCTVRYRRSELESDEATPSLTFVYPEEANVNRLRRHRAMRGQRQYPSV